MIKRLLFKGFNDVNLGLSTNRIYKGKITKENDIVWNDFEEEIIIDNIEDFEDITQIIRLCPYKICAYNYKTLKVGEHYQVFELDKKLYAIDSTNDLVAIPKYITKDNNTVNIKLFEE